MNYKGVVKDRVDENIERLQAACSQWMDQAEAKSETFIFGTRHKYRNARRYIRAHPETSVTIAFFAGLTIGLLMTTLSDQEQSKHRSKGYLWTR